MYIGATGTFFLQRCQDHIKRLRDHSHKNKELQKEYDNNGEKSVSFWILECINCEEEVSSLKDAEDKWIEFFRLKFNILNSVKKNAGIRISQCKNKRYDLLRVFNKHNNRRFLTTISSGELDRYKAKFQKRLVDQDLDIRILSDWRKYGFCFDFEIIVQNLTIYDVTKMYYNTLVSHSEEDYNFFDRDLSLKEYCGSFD